MSFGIVYCSFNTITGKFYVGQTVRSLIERQREHLRDRSVCRLLRRSLKKHGANSFVWTSLSRASSQKELNEAEIMWSHILQSLSPHGYNLKECGEVQSWTKEAKENAKRVHNLPEVKARHSLATKESASRPETKERRSIAQRKVQAEVQNRPTVRAAKQQEWARPGVREERIEAMKRGWRLRKERLNAS